MAPGRNLPSSRGHSLVPRTLRLRRFRRVLRWRWHISANICFEGRGSLTQTGRKATLVSKRDACCLLGPWDCSAVCSWVLAEVKNFRVTYYWHGAPRARSLKQIRVNLYRRNASSARQAFPPGHIRGARPTTVSGGWGKVDPRTSTDHYSDNSYTVRFLGNPGRLKQISSRRSTLLHGAPS